MEIWLNAGFIELDELCTLAPAAEELGFSGIDLPDHLLFPAEIASPYPYSDDGSVLWPSRTPWPDPWVAIGAMAAVTGQLRFATGIQIAPLRDPFSLAKSVATAHAMSGGRVSCGFGVGWLREEFEVVGVDFATRGRRFDEMLGVLRLLWTGESVTHRGAFYTFETVTMRPPAAGVVVSIGGNSPAALRRAARHDGWIGTHRSLSGTTDLIAALEVELADRGRGLDEVRVSLTGPDLVGEDHGALAVLGVNAVTLPIVALGRSRTIDDRLALLESTAIRLGLAPS